jgi:hypothetical protein
MPIGEIMGIAGFVRMLCRGALWECCSRRFSNGRNDLSNVFCGFFGCATVPCGEPENKKNIIGGFEANCTDCSGSRSIEV